MKMILVLSWKNVWRNKLRSTVVILSLAVGVMGGTFMIGVMKGWIAQRSHDAIYVESCHIQLHHPQYRSNEDPLFMMDSSSAIKQYIASLPGVKACASRIQTLAMADAGYKPSGMYVRGINPDEERPVSLLYQCIVDSAGTYFGGSAHKPLLLSERTAKELRLQYYVIDSACIETFSRLGFRPAVIDSLQLLANVNFRNRSVFFDAIRLKLSGPDFRIYKNDIEKISARYRIGKKVELTVRSATGDEVSSVFRLVGVFKTQNTAFDAKFAYVRDADLRELTQWNAAASHEIAVIVPDPDSLETVAASIAKRFPAVETKTWRTIIPEIAMYSDMMDFYSVVFMSVILFALGFGIVNTMLMVVLERTKELGMLMAIGMNRRRIFLMIISETVLLSLVGGIIGMCAGALMVSVFHSVGINISAYAEGMEALGFGAIIYPALDTASYIQITVLVIATGILAAIFPARKATMLLPADAIRTE